MIEAKQISSLEKVRRESDLCYDEICKKTVLKGERYSYQIAIKTDVRIETKFEIESELKDYIRVFCVENAVMDTPLTSPEAIALDDDYITKESGLMPDILVPIEERDDIVLTAFGASSLWIEVNVPKDYPAGKYSVTAKLNNLADDEAIFKKTLELEIANATVLPQSLIYTRWFYADCIADYHNVAVYSEKHWQLIEGYIRQAVDVGINMILVPVHTPPLDTAIGTQRTCVQLVDIEKTGETYTFNFDKFRRYVDICKKCGVKYYEIAHMFSQWGAKCAPNIMVTENGKTDYMFGWHVSADSYEYVNFLKQYIAAISNALKEEGISENAYFHISDEPNLETMETYKRASDIIKPLIGDSKTFDALSEYEFYERGMVECPVTVVSKIDKFLEHKIDNQWAYYCCGPQMTYTNSFLAMPSARVRILGILLYKFNIKGFLHWGLNFYNGCISRYKLNPYMTTSADGVFSSGDPFILYPAKDGAYNSIRGKVTFEAIGDMNLCRTLESYIGRDEVVKLIDSVAGMDVTFANYPKGADFILNLRDKIIEEIKKQAVPAATSRA